MYASRSSGLVCRGRVAASRTLAPRMGNVTARLVSARGFTRTLATQGGKKGPEPTTGSPFKIDEALDDFKDITATNDQIEKNYREPPVEVPGPHGELASTLYASACVLGAEQQVEKDLKWLTEANATIPAFQDLLSTGLPDKVVMRKLLQGVLKGANLHRLTQKFLVVELLEAEELKLVPEIAAAYAQIMKQHRKETPIVFTFASLPDKDFLARQIERVKKYRLDADATPIWQFKIDPTLVGGFIVEVGSGFKGNFALSNQFDYMRQQLKEVEAKWDRESAKELKVSNVDTSSLYPAGASQTGQSPFETLSAAQ